MQVKKVDESEEKFRKKERMKESKRERSSARIRDEEEFI